MTMISPDSFAEEYEDKTYAELIEVRNGLIKDIKQFEAMPQNEESDFLICPSPDVQYQMNLDYLSKICLLIAQKYQEVHETKILKFDPAKVKELNDELLEYRKLAKKDLIRAIGNLLIVKEDGDPKTKKVKEEKIKIAVESGYGVRGYLPNFNNEHKVLPGKLYVNCSEKTIMPKCWTTGIGRADDLKLYRWIPVTYIDDNQEFNYCLDLCCVDLDIGTGEFHTNFTKLQMHKALYSESNEIGGQNVKAGELKEMKDQLGYYVPFRCYLSFPAAVRNTTKLSTMLKKGDEKGNLGSKQKPRLERDIKEGQEDYKHVYAPWDHENFIIKAPVMDLTDGGYDAKKVAEFFIRLVIHDIKEESKKKRNQQ